MAEQQFIMTQKGYEEAKKHLQYLQTTKRQEIVERISEARSHGDLSENAEYDAARNEQAANEGEIVDLDYKIKNAVILEENSDTSSVHIGTKVRVYDPDLDEEELYEITGSTDTVVNLYNEFVSLQCMLQFVKSGRVAVPRALHDNQADLLFNEDYKRKSIDKR